MFYCYAFLLYVTLWQFYVALKSINQKLPVWWWWWCGGGFITDYNTTLRLYQVTLGCGNKTRLGKQWSVAIKILMTHFQYQQHTCCQYAEIHHVCYILELYLQGGKNVCPVIPVWNVFPNTSTYNFAWAWKICKNMLNLIKIRTFGSPISYFGLNLNIQKHKLYMLLRLYNHEYLK